MRLSYIRCYWTIGVFCQTLQSTFRGPLSLLLATTTKLESAQLYASASVLISKTSLFPSVTDRWTISNPFDPSLYSTCMVKLENGCVQKLRKREYTVCERTCTHGQTDRISFDHIMWGSLRLAPIILILQLSVCACVRACVCTSGKVTGSYLTRIKNLAFFASVSFDSTEAVDRNS